MIQGRRSIAVSLALIAPACVGPQVSDKPGHAGLVLPPDSILPSVYDDPAVVLRIDAADGFGAAIPLYSGFVGGKSASYWDVGPAPDFAAPAFVLGRREGDVVTPISHPPIFGRLPGDQGYSPYRRVYTVEVTDAYAGEVIPSAAALNEAQERGLVGPAKGSREGHDWPVTAPDVVVVGGAAAGTAPASAAATGEPRIFFFEGKTGVFFDFGAAPIATGAVSVPALDIYWLHREGGEVLREPSRGVDMDGDGDLLDTNDVFAAAPGDAAYSPRCRPVDVAVGAAVASIDTTRDQNVADLRGAAQLVAAGMPVSPPVVAFRPESETFNCPQRSP